MHILSVLFDVLVLYVANFDLELGINFIQCFPWPLCILCFPDIQTSHGPGAPHLGAVAAKVLLSPGDHLAVHLQRREGARGGAETRHVFQVALDLGKQWISN